VRKISSSPRSDPAASGLSTAESPAIAARPEARLRLSALWTSLLFVFAYVDLFSLYRADVRADIARGELAGFAIGPGFLLGVTLYIVPAALMVCLTLVIAPRLARIANLCLAPLYAVTVVAAAVGEWSYYVLASGVELALLSLIFGIARGARDLAVPANRDVPR